MIKKLRYKFLAVTMLCIGLLFAAILLALNLSMTISSQHRGFETLETISGLPYPEETSRSFPQPSNAAPSREAITRAPAPGHHPNNYIDAFRVFSISYDKSGEVLDYNYNRDTELTEEDILKLGEKVWQAADGTLKERGRVQSRYLYLVRDRNTYWQIYFLDYSVEHSMSYQLFYLCLFVGLAGMLILFGAAFFLSGWMVKPVQRAFIQQKQFIADASHELKTPLTIITANAEVLSASLGENRWLSHILEQTQRMNALIRDLLDLARLDAQSDFQKNPAFAEFDLSRTVSSAALSFESLAFESRRTYRMQIASNLTYFGNEASIRQLVTILLDNAFKYSDENGMITISLTAKGKAVPPADTEAASPPLGQARAHKTRKVLTVYNTGKGISAEDQKHIFERFYRSDSSRSRDTGGYGLGLSIAASIARTHKAKISVQSDGEHYTQITVIL